MVKVGAFNSPFINYGPVGYFEESSDGLFERLLERLLERLSNGLFHKPSEENVQKAIREPSWFKSAIKLWTVQSLNFRCTCVTHDPHCWINSRFKAPLTNYPWSLLELLSELLSKLPLNCDSKCHFNNGSFGSFCLLAHFHWESDWVAERQSENERLSIQKLPNASVTCILQIFRFTTEFGVETL